MKNILFSCFNSSDLNDSIFKTERVWLSSRNINIQKDDKNLGFSYFGKKLNNNNFSVHTQDYWKSDKKIDLQINFAYHQKIYCEKSYLLLPESKEIFPQNDLNKLKKKYTKIFCQYDDYVDNKKIFKINYPFVINNNLNESVEERQLLSCMISSNKSQKHKTENDLYNRRFEVIKFAEDNNINSFNLYGMDWDLPFKKSGIFGRIINFKNKLLNKKIFLNNYKGILKKKSHILKKTKFSFCIENASINGYLSDPIFDSFNNGCVPIYLGAKNIDNHIPENTYIDFRKFKNIESIFSYIGKFNSEEFEQIQVNIKNFINSDKINDFNEKGFTSKIIDHLKQDLM
jgi:hypothetical protein